MSSTNVSDDVITTDPTATIEQDVDAELVVEDLLVEEVSIDGMCGVY